MPEARFVFPIPGEPRCGHAPGVDRARLDDLRRGRVDEDADLDLHGLTAPEARRAVRAALDEAWSEGWRCVRVVHGRGAHSELGPVLREALPGWLTEPPLAERILAFAPAGAGDAGAGATRILLRRRRTRR